MEPRSKHQSITAASSTITGWEETKRKGLSQRHHRWQQIILPTKAAHERNVTATSSPGHLGPVLTREYVSAETVRTGRHFSQTERGERGGAERSPHRLNAGPGQGVLPCCPSLSVCVCVYTNRETAMAVVSERTREPVPPPDCGLRSLGGEIESESAQS